METTYINKTPLHILLVEDNPGDVYIIKDFIKSTETKFSVSHSAKLCDAIKLSGEIEFDVILLDLGLPDSVGLETLQKFLASKVKAPVIVMTGLDDEEIALASVKAGAQDYLVKNNLTSENILRAIRYGIERKKLQEIQERNARQFTILSLATVAMNECEDVPSIYRTICENINRLLNEVTVLPIDLIDQNNTSKPCNDRLEPFFLEILKINKLTESQVLILAGDYLKKVLNFHIDGKPHELIGDIPYQFPAVKGIDVFGEFKKVFNHDKTYTVGFSKDEKHYGGVFIFSKKAIEPNDMDIIEAISSQASLNIQRRNAENDLKISESSYKILFKEVTKAKEALQKLNEELDSKIQIRTQDLAEINTLLHFELNEHILTSEKLKESEEKYRLLFTKMIDGFALYEIILDKQGKLCDYKFISVNPAFEELTGLTARAVIGKTAREILPATYKNKIDIFGEVSLTGKSVEFEDYNAEINKYFKMNAFCPKTGFFAVIFEDITLQIQIENDKQKAEVKLKKYAADLKDLNATKDKFFGIIAHDLKNPFCGLLGASELLIDYVDDFDIDNIKNISLLLNESAKRGFALLENLLEWSRSQTGNIKFNPQILNINELVEENLSNMKPMVLNKKIELHSEITENLETMADKDMFNTILRNLLNNAVKFTHRNGKVTVLANQCDDKVTITIKDTGIGISKKNIDKLFRIDVQYTNIGTEQERGTGLGLLLCKEFVEKHGGHLWVESNLGTGSEFKFTIPYITSPSFKGDKTPKMMSQI